MSRAASRRPLGSHAKALLALAMAWAAGFVDAVGLLVFSVYASHMTGNSAAVARDVVREAGSRILLHGWPIVAFIVGLLYSATATRLSRRRGFHGSLSIALLTELVLLALASAVGPGTNVRGGPPVLFYGTLSCLALAMGIQTVTVTRVEGLRVYTTYLTGSLAKFAEALIQYAFWFHDRTRGRFRKRIGKVLAVTPRIASARHAGLTAGLWIAFVGGAIFGTLAHAGMGRMALAFPMGVLAIATVIDFLRPVAPADEPEETASAH